MAARSAFKQQLQINSEHLGADFPTGIDLSPVTMNEHLQHLQVSFHISLLSSLFLCMFTKRRGSVMHNDKAPVRLLTSEFFIDVMFVEIYLTLCLN